LELIENDPEFEGKAIYIIIFDSFSINAIQDYNISLLVDTIEQIFHSGSPITLPLLKSIGFILD